MKSRMVMAAALLVGVACGSEVEDADQVWGPMAATMDVQVRSGAVGLHFHVTNGGEEAVELTFPTAQRYDLVVSTPEGEEVWRWSSGRVFAQVVTEGRLESGETWDLEASWDHGDRSGVYRATGVLRAMDRPIRKTVEFEVP